MNKKLKKIQNIKNKTLLVYFLRYFFLIIHYDNKYIYNDKNK